ncbi:uncharacterized protein ARMOST_01266 [Armillaria ostoyae]|uniref:Uncharacterized protein n=1 Tax=Armillaria ostoyae TaxID=47428 RepID=A0A284QNL4_ARMOS|nr:uncharacterized protein ARMOST_01266 [Armillaria ostoyae]
MKGMPFRSASLPWSDFHHNGVYRSPDFLVVLGTSVMGKAVIAQQPSKEQQKPYSWLVEKLRP